MPSTSKSSAELPASKDLSKASPSPLSS